MSPEAQELEMFLGQITRPFEGQFADTQSVIPMWFVDHMIEDKKHLSIFATPWANDEEKHKSVALVKAQIKKLNAVRCVHIAEIWELTAKKEDGIPESILLGGKISSHPDRREAVIAIAEDKYGNCIKYRRYILRPEHGKATLAPPSIDHYAASDTKGLLTNLFKD